MNFQTALAYTVLEAQAVCRFVKELLGFELLCETVGKFKD